MAKKKAKPSTSKDSSFAVRVEIRAAEIVANRPRFLEHKSYALDGCAGCGWDAHQVNAVPTPYGKFKVLPENWAGWLAREILTSAKRTPAKRARR